jgi:hypothetical protein
MSDLFPPHDTAGIVERLEDKVAGASDLASHNDDDLAQAGKDVSPTGERADDHTQTGEPPD